MRIDAVAGSAFLMGSNGQLLMHTCFCPEGNLQRCRLLSTVVPISPSSPMLSYNNLHHMSSLFHLGKLLLALAARLRCRHSWLILYSPPFPGSKHA